MINLSGIYHYFYLGKERAGQLLSDILDPFYVKIYCLFALFVNLWAWMGAFFMIKKAPEGPMILHYNVDFGVDLIGSPGQLLVIPALGLTVLAANLSLLFLLHHHSAFGFLSHLLLASAAIVNLFLLISLLPVYSINFG